MASGARPQLMTAAPAEITSRKRRTPRYQMKWASQRNAAAGPGWSPQASGAYGATLPRDCATTMRRQTALTASGGVSGLINEARPAWVHPASRISPSSRT